MSNVNETIVFLGPSLPRVEAEAILPAQYLPPVQCGDIYRCLSSRTRRLVILDGLFLGVRSVWHREILAALDEGLEVLGASSMGALRAVELEAYGMKGMGTVFRWYREGVIEGDDEVALIHAEQEFNYRPFSEPLVNLRATIDRALGHGTVTRDEAHRLLEEARTTFYAERSLQRLMTGAVAAERLRSGQTALTEVLPAAYVNVKAQDAVDLLRWCGASAPCGEPRTDGSRDIHRTLRLAGRELRPGQLGRQLLDRAKRWEGAAVYRRRLALRWYIVEWAKDRGIKAPVDVRDGIRARLAMRHGGDPEWYRIHVIMFTEFERWLEEVALFEWLGTRDDLVQASSPEERRCAIARQWLAKWGIYRQDIPEPSELDFAWGPDAAMLIELLLSGDAEKLWKGVRA